MALATAAVVLPGGTADAVATRCPAGSQVVAKAPLVASGGERLGKIRLVLQSDGRFCGDLRVAKAYRGTALVANTSLSVGSATGVSTYGAGGQGTQVEALTSDVAVAGYQVRYRASLRGTSPGTSLRAKAQVRATAP